jgi:cytochrome c-type biogenesis protein CcmH
MRVLAFVLLALAIPATALAAKARTTLPDVEDEVMCIQCGTVLNISQAPSANQERDVIRKLISQGKTKDQIKAALVDQYGPKVLAEPHQTPAWLIPLILALIAAATVTITVRRWRRIAEDKNAGPELDDDQRDRLDRDMASYEL